MTRPTVVVALHDGFSGCGTGAGRSNYELLRTLTGLLTADVQLLVLPVHLKPISPEYDPIRHAETITMLARVGASVYPVDNGTGGLVRFGGVDCFRRLVHHTTEVLTHQVLPDAGPVLILALDVPFIGLAPLLPTDVVPNLVLVPRSTSRIHVPDDCTRIFWEFTGLRVTVEHGGRIVAISSFMRAHLRNDYEVPEHSLIDLPNGLSPADWKLTPPNQELLPAPAQKGFLLALGRAHPCKGFEDLLDGLVLLRQQGIAVPHVVLAAVTDHPEPNDHQQQLARRIATQGLNVTLLTRFHPDIRRLLAHHALRGVVVPSRAEPFGRVPIEAYAAGASPVISTIAGGLAEQVIDGRTGLTAAPGTPASLAAALRRALTLTPTERNHMRDEARRFAASRYNYPQAVQALLLSSLRGRSRHHHRRP